MHGDVFVTEHEDLEDDFVLVEGIQNGDGRVVWQNIVENYLYFPFLYYYSIL